MLGPDGILNIYEPISPIIIEKIAVHIPITKSDLKLLAICIEVIVGKIIELEISKVPSTLIPNTIVIEVSTDS
ncbi:MAG TPA: hypothetical protein PK083_05895, partial [Soehngenia sp.]|nr:hypothetical protein [Soehngenia sp.]